MPTPQNSDAFYAELAAISDFGLVASNDSYRDVPSDWDLFITDVANSTEAIARGEYKEVNTAGALSLVALINAGLAGKIATVFGGDGILLLAPPSARELLKDLFSGIRSFVRENFDLDLRVGFVSVADLAAKNLTLRLGKFSASGPGVQAIFAGTGLAVAEQWIKSPGSTHLVSADHIARVSPDFSGYSCPFREVGSNSERVMALILRAHGELANYQSLLRELFELLGPESEFHPLTWSNLTVRTTAQELHNWAVISSGTTGGWYYRLVNAGLRLRMALTRLLTKAIQKTGERLLPRLTDHKKFDGALKMVFKVGTSRRDALMDWLTTHEAAGDFVFGLHESRAALITCVFQGSNSPHEVHLIDGAEGGYTLAAAQLKAKLAARSEAFPIR